MGQSLDVTCGAIPGRYNVDRRLIKLGSACYAEYEAGLLRHPVPKYVEIRNRQHTGRVDKYINIVLDGWFSGSAALASVPYGIVLVRVRVGSEPYSTSPASTPERSAYGIPPTSTLLLHY